MIGYNVSSDTNYSPYYGKDGSIPPSYDPNAGFSYWKVKNDGKSIELGW
jgi:hypothetical protein